MLNDASMLDFANLLTRIHQLGGPSKFHDWKITGQRAPVIPERLKVQQKWMEEEAARLKAGGVMYEDRTQTVESTREQALGTRRVDESIGVNIVAVA
jgi:hypothetical protein